jgi:hypothetical protein
LATGSPVRSARTGWVIRGLEFPAVLVDDQPAIAVHQVIQRALRHPTPSSRIAAALQ